MLICVWGWARFQIGIICMCDFLLFANDSRDQSASSVFWSPPKMSASTKFLQPFARNVISRHPVLWLIESKINNVDYVYFVCECSRSGQKKNNLLVQWRCIKYHRVLKNRKRITMWCDNCCAFIYNCEKWRGVSGCLPVMKKLRIEVSGHESHEKAMNSIEDPTSKTC